ncbi:DUF6182 family protein [Streptosporangium roseum]|uniref:Uncharacterized protein n=1 Tax=Streptosporangium roseum (strain ATCC 12428 / DSM 43021 / JCM 3005 / KCTC 9067 / NCIMB 10171 / NRRL 2505 / NI 9100) TaxID=479432 RepID=D2B4M3_STRRD|nr:DUF6182 family protein [Streptosporangium roseum]ACZ83709.1 hypothetical protein Sros_0686 [Streptosporangium roseum DSM 43021]
MSVLDRLFAERAASVRSGLSTAGAPDPGGTAGPGGAMTLDGVAGPGGAADSGRQVTVMVVMRRLDLGDLVQGALEFTGGLSPEEADIWYRNWTRTRFLLGNPHNLLGSAAVRTVGPGGHLAWLGPVDVARPPGPSRLLKPVTGRLPELPPSVHLPGGRRGAPCEIRIACRGLTTAGYLIHLHHTLAEAVLLGRIDPRTPVRLVHVPDLDEGSALSSAYARVHYGADGALRLYTFLSRGERWTSRTET